MTDIFERVCVWRYFIAILFAFAICLFNAYFVSAVSLPPNNGPEEAPLHYVVSSGSNSGSGSNLLYSPNVYLKIYSTNANAKTVTITNEYSCSGTKQYIFHQTNEQEKRPFGQSTLLQTSGGGCGTVNVTIPAGYLNQSQVPGHVGLYIGILQVSMQPETPTVNGPLTSFKVRINNGGIGSWGIAADEGLLGGPGQINGRFTQSIIGRPSPGEDTYRLKFKPPCTFFDGGPTTKSIYLKWYDDDSGTSYQGPFSVRLIEQDEKTGQVTGSQPIDVSDPSGTTGEARFEETVVQVKKGHRYIWEWQGIDRRNGVQVWYPFDSGDFDLQCPSDWNISPSSRVAPATLVTGQVATFTHSGRNTGNIDGNPLRRIQSTVVGNLAQLDSAAWGFKPGSWTTNIAAGSTWNVNQAYTAIAEHAGRYYCERLVVVPRSSSNPSGTVSDPPACVFVNGITDGWIILSDSSRIEREGGGGDPESAQPGDIYNFYHRVYNAGPDPVGWVDFPGRVNIPDQAYLQLRNVHPGEPQRVDPLHLYYFNNSPSRPSNNRDFARIYAFQAGAWKNSLDPFLLSDFRGQSYFTEAAPVISNGSNAVSPNSSWYRLQIGPQHGGSQFCQQGFFTPRSYNRTSSNLNAAQTPTSRLCVKVPFYYTLTPSVTVGPNRPNQGDNVTGTGSINNPTISDRFHTHSENVAWELIQRIIDPNGNSTPDRIVDSGSTVVPAGSTVPAGQHTQDTSGLPAGTKICYKLRISRTSHNNSSAVVSQEECQTIVKAPLVQIQSDDIRVGRNFPNQPSGSCSPAARAGISTNSGSWVEYGAFASGAITNFGSARLPSAADLTFANTPGRGNFWSSAGCMPNYIAEYVSDQSTVLTGNDINLGTVNLGQNERTYTRNGDTTVSGDVSPGKKMVIYVDGDLTISGNIEYANGPYSSIGNIPRVILIANNIIINENVERVDAWLVTRGELLTCSEGRGPLTVTICNDQLITNGAIVANQISLRRTFGADATTAGGSNAPAEIFNLHPHNFMTTYNEALRNANATTVFQVELPPRY